MFKIFVRFKHRVSGIILKKHAAERPDVDLLVPRVAVNNFGRSIMPRRDCFRMMVAFKYGRAEINDDNFRTEKTARFWIAGNRLDKGPLAFEENVFRLEFEVRDFFKTHTFISVCVH